MVRFGGGESNVKKLWIPTASWRRESQASADNERKFSMKNGAEAETLNNAKTTVKRIDIHSLAL
jgi:peptidase E